MSKQVNTNWEIITADPCVVRELVETGLLTKARRAIKRKFGYDVSGADLCCITAKLLIFYLVDEDDGFYLIYRIDEDEAYKMPQLTQEDGVDLIFKLI